MSFFILFFNAFLLSLTEAFGTTWSKHYCQYTKENRIFTMIPYTQTIGKIVSFYFMTPFSGHQLSHTRYLMNHLKTKKKYIFFLKCNHLDVHRHDGNQILHSANVRFNWEKILLWHHAQGPAGDGDYATGTIGRWSKVMAWRDGWKRAGNTPTHCQKPVSYRK